MGYMNQKTPPTSKNILEEAISVVFERQGSYDAPENNFNRIADFWNAYIKNKPEHKVFDATDVSIMMILLKIARLTFQYKEDSVVDIAGYAQCLSQINKKTSNL